MKETEKYIARNYLASHLMQPPWQIHGGKKSGPLHRFLYRSIIFIKNAIWPDNFFVYINTIMIIASDIISVSCLAEGIKNTPGYIKYYL